MAVQEVRFYHLQKTMPEDALLKLLPRILPQYKNIVVATVKPNIKKLSQKLWHDEQAFLPHGFAGEKITGGATDGFAKDQPIWINDDGANANNATLLCVINNHSALISAGSIFENYDMVCMFFDGANPEILTEMRNLWRAFKNPPQDDSSALNAKPRYYREDNNGVWNEQ